MTDAGLPDPTAPDAATRGRRRLRSAQEVRDRRRRLITMGLVVALGALLVNAVVGENGYLATRRARQEYDAARAELARIRIENQTVQQESRRLQRDPAAVEEQARRDLGFARPGETLIVLRDAKPAPAPAPPATRGR
jgi:cell division protein FtsB